jgi:hypothetical protein
VNSLFIEGRELATAEDDLNIVKENVKTLTNWDIQYLTLHQREESSSNRSQGNRGKSSQIDPFLGFYFISR